MKKAVFAVITVLMVFCFAFTANAEDKTIEVKLNNMALTFDVKPANIQGRVLVPLRVIFEQLGMDVDWVAATKTVTGSKNGNTVKLVQDSTDAYVNGALVKLDVPAQIIGGRTMVPVRFIAESTGAKVFWDSASQTVYISTSTDQTITLEKILLSAHYSDEGYKLGENGNTSEAIVNYDKAMEIDPFNYSAHYLKGRQFISEKKYTEAIACIDEAVKINSCDYEAYEFKGSALYSLEKYSEAAACYETAVQLNKEKILPALLNILGDFLSGKDKYEEAISFYDIVIKYYKTDIYEAYNKKGNALRRLDRVEEALTCYDKAIAVKPKYADAYINKGNAYRELGNQVESLKCFDKAIELAPANSYAYLLLYIWTWSTASSRTSFHLMPKLQ